MILQETFNVLGEAFPSWAMNTWSPAGGTIWGHCAVFGTYILARRDEFWEEALKVTHAPGIGLASIAQDGLDTGISAVYFCS